MESAMERFNRRQFLALSALLPLRLREEHRPIPRESSVVAALKAGESLPFGAPSTPSSVSAVALREAFPDLRRHFVFEYYPWYGRDPWRHWNEAGRNPPDDLATEYFPRLGPYDSRDLSVLEQHARWIAESGAGSIALSWWGSGDFEDRSVDRVMDVMKDHGIAVTFGLEPYAVDRGIRFVDDVLYLLTRYGERRGWDAFLVLKNADGSEAPVFKVFRSILPRTVVDCHGVTHVVSDYTPDELWRRQIATLRRELRWDFDRIVLLADSLDFGRTPDSGFDGIGIYDNFIAPEQYHPLARGASERGLLFSFNVNPGYDEVLLQEIAPDSCYVPPPFEPPSGAPLDFTMFEHREAAALLSADRVRRSLSATVAAQTDPALVNHQRGFFLVYVNSFNEWHEGHAFEPMKNDVELTADERVHGYHNPAQGDYRLIALANELRSFL